MNTYAERKTGGLRGYEEERNDSKEDRTKPRKVWGYKKQGKDFKVGVTVSIKVSGEDT